MRVQILRRTDRLTYEIDDIDGRISRIAQAPFVHDLNEYFILDDQRVHSFARFCALAVPRSSTT